MSILHDTPPPPPPEPRFGPHEPVSDLWWPILVALLMWMLVPAAVLNFARRGQSEGAQSTTRAIDDYSPTEMAAMAISGSAAGLVTLLVASARFGAFDRLGLSSRKLSAGLRKGIVASLFIVPMMFAVMQGTQWLWNYVQYRHPDEHELLKALGNSSSPAIRLSLVVSAVVLAPAFEELMFRGYLQTALAATIARRRAVSNTSDISWPRWPAIVIASLAFTAVHMQPWLMPPIFVLSLCLGYVYERTGNLWAPIVIHAMFNSVSTFLFLYFR